MLIMFQRNLRLTNDWLKPQLSFLNKNQKRKFKVNHKHSEQIMRALMEDYDVYITVAPLTENPWHLWFSN